MVRSVVIITCFLALIIPLISYAEKFEKSFPEPKGAINDFADVIPEEYERRMEKLSSEVLDQTGTSIVVATFKSIGNEDINDFANRLYEAWGVGKRGEDRGVLIVLALEERKIRIETGYGVEAILPDGLVGEILDTYAVPYLKKGEYGRGLYSTMLAVASVIAKEKGVTLSEKRKMTKFRAPFPLLLLILIILIFFSLPFSSGRIRKRRSYPLIFIGGPLGHGGSFGPFGGGFGGFGGGLSGGGGATRSF